MFIFFIIGIILFSVIIPAYAQDISQLMAEKYSLQVDEQTFDVYYGFKGSLEVDISDLEVEIGGCGLCPSAPPWNPRRRCAPLAEKV